MTFGQSGAGDIIFINDSIVLSFSMIMSHLEYPQRLLSHHFLENAKGGYLSLTTSM